MFDKSLNGILRSYSKKYCLIKSLGGICRHCGESRFQCLQFHHINPEIKEYDVLSKRSGRYSIMESEANKCILLCSDCHRTLHNKSINKNPKRNINKRTLLNYKNTNLCKSCNKELDLSTFHFHHLYDKKYLISSRITNLSMKTVNDIPQDLKEEVDKCICLCGNCHLDIHFDFNFYKNNLENIIKLSENIRELQPKLDKQKVLDMFNSGISQIEISRNFNASKGTICGILKSFGLTRLQSDINLSRDIIKELHTLEKTSKEISIELNCQHETINTILKELGLTKHDKPYVYERKFDPTKEELIELMKTKTYTDIGKMFGIKCPSVIKRAKILGVYIKTR
jgi:DNA-binding CsgD family transcriptional regulator